MYVCVIHVCLAAYIPNCRKQEMVKIPRTPRGYGYSESRHVASPSGFKKSFAKLGG